MPKKSSRAPSTIDPSSLKKIKAAERAVEALHKAAQLAKAKYKAAKKALKLAKKEAKAAAKNLAKKPVVKGKKAPAKKKPSAGQHVVRTPVAPPPSPVVTPPDEPTAG